MSPLPSVDLITPCRNRVEYLRVSLPSWLACPQIQRIIIVDFNSTIPVVDTLGDLKDERVTVVRVDEEPIWRQGRAQNIGLGLAQGDLVLKTDADVSTVDIQTYVEKMSEDSSIFFKGYCKLGTSSGLCMAPRHQMKSIGGYHDHMSGWGGDDVDLYRRLKKRKLKALLFQPESFQEQGQKMAGKNSEARRLDSDLIADHQQLAQQPYFSGFRNTLLARIQRQNKRVSLRWRYTPSAANPCLVHAKLRRSSHWRLQSARCSIELANILAITYYPKDDSVWDVLRCQEFLDILESHRLPKWRSRMERQQILDSIPDHKRKLRKLAKSLGVPLLSEQPNTSSTPAGSTEFLPVA